MQRRLIRLLVLIPLIAFVVEAQANESAVEIEEYVSTGTRTDRLISEAPVQTELYTSDEFLDFNITSLKDAISLIPSARFESDCQNCGLNQIQLLGLSTDSTAILFDGAPLYSGLAKVYGADLFPAIFVDRIEVVKGGGSVLYGAEAIAGVVNLISAEPLEKNLQLRGSIESFLDKGEEEEQSFTYDYVSDDLKYSFTLYGLHQKRDGIDLTTDGFTEIPEFQNNVLGLAYWYHPTEYSNLKVTYQLLNEMHRGGDRLDLPSENARIAESLAHKIHTTGVKWDQELDGDLDYSLYGTYSYIARDSFYNARAASEQTAFTGAGNSGTVTSAFINSNQSAIDSVANRAWGETDNHVYYLDGQVNKELDNHTLSAGLQYRYEILEDASPNDSSVSTTKSNYANVGVFIQDQWEISDDLELVPGIRADKHDNVGDLIVSPRIALRYDLCDETMLRAAYSTGFNAPGAFNEDQHIGVRTEGGISLTNAAGLKEESSTTYSFGVEHKPNQKTAMLSQVHFTKIKDTFDIDDSDALNWKRINGPDSDVLVWENVLSRELTEQLTFDGSISYIYSRFDTPVSRVSTLTTDEYIESPEITGSVGLSYENHELVDGFLTVNYTGPMLAVAEDKDFFTETSSFWEVDTGLSKEFDNLWKGTSLTLSGGVKNIFDERQKDIDNTGEDRDPTYFYGPTRPRSFYITAEINF